MQKLFKVLCSILLIAMLFSMTACGGNSLQAYREIKKEEIQNYADAKGQDNFSEENWDAICGFVRSGKNSIDEATEKSEVDRIVSEVKAAVDGVEQEESDRIGDGVYFITDESYEFYVRNCAKQVGADEQWVADVLNGGDGDEWHYLIRPQSWFWCVIAENQITVCKVVDTVYNISSNGDTYQGSSLMQTVTFWFEDDVLFLNDTNETLQYRKDNSYLKAGTETLAAPQDVTISSGGEGLNYVTFWWNYQSAYGSFGAVIEIKTSSSQEYRAQKTEQVYMNMFGVQLDESCFETGVNWVRIYHIGGPTITNDRSIIVKKNSDYALFRVTVSQSGNVNVEEVSL